MEYAFSVDTAEGAKLKKVLEANPYDKESFTYLGYTLKESQAVDLPPGKLVVHFKTDNDALAAKLISKMTVKAADKLKEIEAKGPIDPTKKDMIMKGLEDSEIKSLVELKGADKDKVCKKIADEQNSAAAGFGSIFG